MTDLTNKVDELIKTNRDSIQATVNKFVTILQGTLPEKNIPYLAYIIDICVNHINDVHKDLSKDWKAWAVLVVRNSYLNGTIKKDEDIVKIIDEFIVFWKSDYKKYCGDIISASEYDRDRGFVYVFLNKKIGSY